jgi:hypothetical protein
VKRICLLGAAIAGILIIGVASALAAAPHAAKSGGTKSSQTKLKCTSSLVLQVAPGATDVTPASETGSDAGPASCTPFGKGFATLSYGTDAAGDLTGKWQEWFATGSVFGTFDLTPSDNAPPTTSTSFSAQSLSGTFVIKSGTGAYARATGRGTLSCNSQDSVHFSCKAAGKYALPAAKS